MGGSERAEYGKGLISALAEDLTKEFGKDYSIRNLHYYIKFYQCFPDEQIVNACVHNLNWTHIRSPLRVADENARYWYMKEAIDENWSSRTLDRNISTQYYHRLLQAPKKEALVEGQEFDNVMIVIDNNFRYSGKGELEAKEHPNPDYLFPRLFYQNISRTREKLCIVVLENKMIFEQLLKIKMNCLEFNIES